MLRNISSGLVRSVASSSKLQLPGLRLLFTAEALGLDGFKQNQSRTAQQYNGPQMKEKFMSRIQEFMSADNNNLIFTDDLKTMLTLAEDTPEDILLLNSMIERFNNQNSGVRFGSFAFGPVIMRFYHLVNKPAEVLSLLNNPNTVGMFDQFTSYQIAMDLLLRNKMYNEVLQVFKLVQGRNIQGSRYPKNAFIIAMAALYRMNTPESFEMIKKTLIESDQAGFIPQRRCLTYAAALAIRQNDPQWALNILGVSTQQNYVTVRNLKALALAKIGRFDDIIALCQGSLNHDTPDVEHKRVFTHDVIEAVRSAIESSVKKEMLVEFSRVYKNLVDRKLIDSNRSLDELLDQPIDRLNPAFRDGGNFRNNNTFDRRMVNQSFNQRDGSYQRNTNNNSRPMYPNRRPGLGEME